MSANAVKTKERKDTTSNESTMADLKKVRVGKIDFCQWLSLRAMFTGQFIQKKLSRRVKLKILNLIQIDDIRKESTDNPEEGEENLDTSENESIVSRTICKSPINSDDEWDTDLETEGNSNKP